MSMKSRLAFLQQHVLPALVCFALAVVLAKLDWLQGIENSTLDVRTRFRTQYFPTQPRDDTASRSPAAAISGRNELYTTIAQPNVRLAIRKSPPPNR